MSINNIQELNVGLNGAVGFKPIVIKQYDKNTRRIEITLLEGSNIYEIPVGAVAKFQATKKDGTIIFDDCDIENGMIIYKATEGLSTCDGTVKCEVGLYNSVGDELLQSSTFDILVEKSAMDRNAVTSSSEFNTLTIMINTITGLVERAENTIKEINTALSKTEAATSAANQAATEAQQATATINTTNQTITNNENTRITDENTRKTNETTRQSQEGTRQTNSTTAVTKADAATTRANLAAKSCEDIASGIIQLPDIGTPGTYTKVTTDIKGRVTSGSTPTAIADLGITNVYTKSEIDTKTSDINTSLGNQVGTASGASINLPNSFNGGLLLNELQGKSIQASVPTPATPVSIVSVGDSGNVVAKFTGKNILKITSTSNTARGVTYTNNGDGSFTLNGTATEQQTFRLTTPTISSDGNPLPMHGTYTLSIDNTNGLNEIQIMSFGDFKTMMNLLTREGKTTLTKVVDNNAVFAYVHITQGAVINNQTYRLQLEVGSSATPYEPYKEQLITIPLTQPLRSVGSVYDRGCVKSNGLWGNERKFGYEIFDGSDDEGWVVETTNTTGLYRVKCSKITNLAKKLANAEIVPNILCDRYSVISSGATYRNVKGISIATKGTLILYDDAYTTTDISLYKTWLKANPIAVIYELATPIFEPYSQPLQDVFNKLQSNQGQTNIFSTDPQQPTIVVQYGKTDTAALALYASNVNASKIDMSKIANNFVTTEKGFVAGAETVKILKDDLDKVNNNLPLFYHGSIQLNTTTNHHNEFQGRILYSEIIQSIVGNIPTEKTAHAFINGSHLSNDGSVLAKCYCNQSTVDISGSVNGSYTLYVVIVVH